MSSPGARKPGWLRPRLPRDVMSGPLEPDVMLREQYEGSAPETGEQRLRLAIIEQSLRDYQLTQGVRPIAYWDSMSLERLGREVREWFASDDEEWPFTFVNCCEAINVDPGLVRAGLAMGTGTFKVMRFAQRRKEVDSRG